MIGRLSSTLGWTKDEILDSSFPEIQEIFQYWQREPPVHDLLRWFVGYTAPEEKRDSNRKRPPQLNKAEQQFLDNSGPVISFDRLPVAVQRAILWSKPNV